MVVLSMGQPGSLIFAVLTPFITWVYDLYLVHCELLLSRVSMLKCTACQEIYSVRHVLIDCIDLGLIRPRFYTVPDLKTLFDTVSVDRILSFLKEVNLFAKI